MARFAKVPWNPVIYGYLTIDKKAARLLGIIDSFNTFSEIRSDLELINPELYELSLERPRSLGVTYTIVGHGFLRKVNYELQR